jgi:uncharacterized membrane protein
MKCIKCATDNKLKDRQNISGQNKCTRCGHPFVFEPTQMTKVKITDPFFYKVINDISANNTLYFTPKQFYYFLEQRLKRKNMDNVGVNVGIFLFLHIIPFIGAVIANCIIIWLIYSSRSQKENYKTRQIRAKSVYIIGLFVLILGTIISLATEIPLLFFISVIWGMFLITMGKLNIPLGTNAHTFLLTQNDFDKYLEAWIRINSPILKMLDLPDKNNPNAPAAFNPEIANYSFDRLVVCDSDNITQMLIANNFHFENNCAILSITGYPQSIFNPIMEMLRRNPELKVYALHDCSPKGLTLINRLRTSNNWFLNHQVTIIDIGILPRQIMESKRSILIELDAQSAVKSTELDLEIRSALSPQELKWLDEGNFLKLESFTPETIIKVLQKGIAGTHSLDSSDSDLIFVGDSSNDIYIVESFG